MRAKIAAVIIGLLLVGPEMARAQIGEKVRIGGFLIDRTEVTVGQFRTYATAQRIQTAAEREGGGYEWAGGWVRREGWNVYRPFGGVPASEAEPAVHVSWMEAEAYCRSAGGRLPTAREWLEAAYTESRNNPPPPFAAGRIYAYPSGDRPDGANTSAADRWPRSAPAGETVPGINGLYDMGGNVWEWVADGSADNGGDERRTMGGSWWYGADQMKADVRAFKPAAFFAVYVGFRCAYDAPV